MKPTLIVVCGAPASGKTTLARRLATDLRLPLLEKDTIKESLADVIETPDREASRRIGMASTKLLYDLAYVMAARGVDVIIECNFSPRFAVTDLERMARVASIRIVQCEAERDTVIARYRHRHADGARHPAHFDLDALPDLISGLESGDYDLTGLGYRAITVRTDDGYHPLYEEIVATLRT